jgi:signal transduction histidine kinase
MEIALREIERLNGLITSFLDYARPQQTKLEPFDLGRDIHSMVEAITGLLSDSEAPSVVVAESAEEAWVNADRDQLRGVLWNLIRNAWEAGEQDRISVRVRALSPDHVELEVQDRAQGIPSEQLEQIFEPFFTTKDAGTGLGLAMVHRIVQDHGGTIDASSVVGEGTTFTLRLPRLDPKELAKAGG